MVLFFTFPLHLKSLCCYADQVEVSSDEQAAQLLGYLEAEVAPSPNRQPRPRPEPARVEKKLQAAITSRKQVRCDAY
jgi:hypothetical protein